MVLPVADLGLGAWRILYLVPLLFLPVVLRFGRLLPESRRYVAPTPTCASSGTTTGWRCWPARPSC